jgi:hypothetical protein
LPFEALKKLWSGFRESSHDFRASTEIAPQLETDKLSKALNGREKGEGNGRVNPRVNFVTVLG